MIIFFLSVLLLSKIGIAYASYDTASGCETPTAKLLSNLPGVDNARVISVAQASSQYQALTSGLSVALNIVLYDSKFDSKSCTLNPSAVAANFVTTYPNGTQHTVLVTENVPPSIVTNVQTFPALYASVNSNPSPTWSGYKFSGNQGITNPVKDADGSFPQPTIDFPANHGTNQPGCGWPSYCRLAIWTGLETGGSSNNILQTGTMAVAPSGGSITYQLFVEDWPAHSAGFCSNPVSAGDTIKPQVYDATIVGGSSGYFYVQTTDTTNGWTCSTSPNPYSWSHTAYYGDFIMERPGVGCCWTASLPYFSPAGFWFQGRVYYDTSGVGAYHSIADPYVNGWGQWYYMINSNVWNMCSGSYSGGTCSQYVTLTSGYGEFQNTWITSQYT
jgi:hypothetical protein